MAKQSSVNLDITNNPDGFDISGGTVIRKISITGGDITVAGSGSATLTFPTTSTTIAGIGITQSFTATQTFSAGISASGATFSGNISAPNIVTAFNGLTGAVTGVASIGGFTGTVTFSDGTYTTVRKSSNDILINNIGVHTLSISSGSGINALTASGTTGVISYSISNTGVTGISAGTGISVSSNTGNPTITNIGVQSFNGLTGAVAGVTTSAANIFTALNTFSAGLSASGATFANDIKVNGVNIGLGGGNVASNLGIGKGALTGNSTGLFNTAVGSGAMEIGTNSYSVAFGFNALHSCTGGGINNVALGSNTLSTISSASNNVAIGTNTLQNLVDGNYNVSIGGESLGGNGYGSSNLAIGYQALSSNSTSNNVGIGYQALYTNDQGQENTAIGNEALKSITSTGSAERNTAIGYQAGRWRGTGTGVVLNRLNTANDSIFIGWRARSSADAQNNQIVIGNNTLGGGSNTITIGTTASTDATIYGKLHGTNGVSGPTASFNSLTVNQNSTLGSTASNTTTIYGAKIVNESIYSNGTLRTVGINFANGQVQTLTGIGTGATGTTAIYFTGAPATGAGNVTLLVTNGGSMTGNTTTWEGRIKWPGGVKPTLSTTGIDVVSFITPDAGTTIYGFLGGLNFS